MGVGAEILTRVYGVFKPDYGHFFWVGDNLANGAFIQFGYGLFSPGYYCLYGEEIGTYTNCLGSSDSIASTDPRWFWEYWPNPKVIDFYFGTGPADSAAPNGAWHHYQIWPNVANGWNFVLDGQTVWSFNSFQSTTSKDPAFVVAEEVISLPSASGNLGPVEFRNLEYLTQNGWQQVRSLTAISGCGVLSPNCGTIPYGVASLGANDILAGAGVHQVLNNQLLWTAQVTLTLNAPYQAIIVVDDQYQVSGGRQISLMPGEHLLAASLVVSVSDGVRLRFDHWSDGYQYAGRNLYLDSDTTLEAVYVTQYKLTIISPLPASGDGWYDEGSNAIFSINVFPITINSQGLWLFVGWYTETGDFVTIFGSGSIMMGSPHTLEAKYLHF
jgi:hypothetical protein